MHRLSAILIALLLCLGLLAGCAAPTAQTSPSAADPTAEPTPEATAEPIAEETPSEEPADATPAVEDTAARPNAVRIAALNGPSGMGLVDLMSRNDAGTAAGSYTFTMHSAPDAIVAALTSGEADIAALPINLAATLHQKTQGGIVAIAGGTLGVMSILERGDSVKTLADLSGKTIYATGQGATPEYVLAYLLGAAGAKDVKVEYLAEHAELATKLVAGDVDLAMLPQPFVTSAMMQAEDLRLAIDLTPAWKEKTNTDLVQTAIVVRAEFLEGEGKAAVDAFLADYAASVQAVNADPENAGALVESYGIMPKAALAAKAIPLCHLVCLTGDDMKTAVEGTLRVLFESNPASVGGAMPDATFYYGAAQ